MNLKPDPTEYKQPASKTLIRCCETRHVLRTYNIFPTQMNIPVAISIHFAPFANTKSFVWCSFTDFLWYGCAKSPRIQEYNFITVYYKTIIHTRHNFVYGADHKTRQVKTLASWMARQNFMHHRDCYLLKKMKTWWSEVFHFVWFAGWHLWHVNQLWKLENIFPPNLYPVDSVRLICCKKFKFIKEIFFFLSFLLRYFLPFLSIGLNFCS